MDIKNGNKTLRKELCSHTYDPSYEQMCGRKIPYQKKERATEAMAVLVSKGSKGLHIYTCPYCNQYHVGHSMKALIQARATGSNDCNEFGKQIDYLGPSSKIEPIKDWK